MCASRQSWYRNQVWSAMTNSKDPNQRIGVMRLYLDESGGKDPNTPHALVGGLLIGLAEFQPFEDAWDSLLKEFSIEPPLHMKEFGRPHGKFAKLSDCCRHDLFSGVAELICTYPQLTMSASLKNQDVAAAFNKEIADKFSVYGVCFLRVAYLNHCLAVHNNYPHPIPFFLDTGNPHKNRVTAIHDLLVRVQRKGIFLHIGSLTFDDDTNFGVLQAADVIAWAERRRLSSIPLNYPFEPLQRIFASHSRHSWIPNELNDMNRLTKQLVAEVEANDDQEDD